MLLQQNYKNYPNIALVIVFDVEDKQQNFRSLGRGGIFSYICVYIVIIHDDY